MSTLATALGYYESLSRPNVELTNKKIAHFTENGVLCQDGTEIQVDVIVLATGFQLTSDKVALDLNAYVLSLLSGCKLMA